MKILVVTNLFHPDRGGGASIITDVCVALTERGHSIEVLTTYPYYPEWRRKSCSSPWRVSIERFQGMTIRRYGLYIPAAPSQTRGRVAFELSYFLSLLRDLGRRCRYDAVMVYCPALAAVAYASVRRVLFREPTWLNVQDLPAEAAAASGFGSNVLVGRVGPVVQSLLFNRSDVWSSIAPEMVAQLHRIRRRGQPILLVPNFLNESMSAEIRSHPCKLGRTPSAPLRLLYAGNIGKKQDLLAFCRKLAATDLDFEFKVVGDGSESAKIRMWVSSCGDPRFSTHAFLDESSFVDALFAADLFIITETPAGGASFMPSKLIPCIATGTPILCVADSSGPLRREVDRYGLGLSFGWSDLDQLTHRIQKLLHTPAEFVGLQENALERAKAYRRRAVIDMLEAELRHMASGELART
jgi:colanic acid biosynthesis glycosyl transferase WcaI